LVPEARRVVKKANLSGGKGLTKQNASRQLTASAQDTTDEAKGPAVATSGKTDKTDTTDTTDVNDDGGEAAKKKEGTDKINEKSNVRAGRDR
jgi:hypothetical protein